MKTKFLFAFFLITIFIKANPWTKKADMPSVTRSSCASFSIGAKGYIGTGYNQGGSNLKDFWEWDQASDVWTQKSDFGGLKRGWATGFSIGAKGYIGLGSDGFPVYSDFWEYDPSSNTWTQKSNFGGGALNMSVSFSIGSKGYVGTGEDQTFTTRRDFWEYNAVTNVWTQKANFGGVARERAVGFSIGAMGYIGAGNTAYLASGADLKDFWEYDPSLNTWTKKADVGGPSRHDASGFSIGAKGYVGMGSSSTVWEYDPGANTWKQKTSLDGRSQANSFSIGGLGYIVGGSAATLKDLWEYDPAADCMNTVISDFSANSYTVNTGAAVTFTNSSTGASTYSWLNNGTQFSTSQNASYTYSASGTYTVSLIASGTLCVDTLSKIITVKCVVSGFNVSADTVLLNGTVSFTNTSAGAASYTWLNNGISFSSSVNASYTYSVSAGTYTVSLVAANGPCTDTLRHLIVVRCVVSGFQYIPSTVMEQDTVYFTNTSQGASTYTWTSNGTQFSTGTSPTHVFTAPGNYTVSLTAAQGPCSDIIKTVINVKPCNKWFQKADIMGSGFEPSGFVIGTKLYLGTQDVSQNFWEYDGSTNAWTQKADFGGGARSGAVGFAIGNKGYRGTGAGGKRMRDLWEYDPSLNTWTKKADLPGSARNVGVGFSIGNMGYVGLGYDTSAVPKKLGDFWQYDPSADNWTQKANFGGGGRITAIGFCIGNRGYVGMGDPPGGGASKDFWRYDPATDTWIVRASLPGAKRYAAMGFALGRHGYCVCGVATTGYSQEVWEYDTLSNAWTKLANFPGNSRGYGAGFSVGSDRGYIAGGSNSSGPTVSEFWLFKADSCGALVVAPTISINGTNPTCFGLCNGSAVANVSGSSSPYTYLWSNNQTTKTATGLCANMYTVIVKDAVGATKISSVTLSQPTVLNVNATSPATICSGSCATLTATAAGGNGGYKYSWLPTSQTTSAINVCPSTLTDYTVTVTDSKLCSAMAVTTLTVSPGLATPTITASGPTIFCQGNDVTLSSSAGNSYLWSSGATDQDITVTVSGNYSVTITNASNCSATSVMPVTVLTTTASITPSGSTTICQGNTVALTANPGSSYLWSTAATTQSIVVNQTGSYTVYVSNTCGSDTSSPVNVLVNSTPTFSVTVINASACTLSDGSATANASSGTPPYSYTWSNGGTTAAITGLASGNYTLTVTDANNCAQTNTATVTCPTDITESDIQNHIEITPNPSTGVFFIHSENIMIEISIVNMLGEKIYVSQLSSVGSGIDLSKQPKGIYFISIRNESGIATKKLIIQ